MAGGEGVEVGEAKVAGAIAAVGRRLPSIKKGEGGVDVADIVPVGDAVQVEVHRVELRAEAKAAFLLPSEGGSYVSGLVHVAEVSGEGGHVVGGVGQFQHRLAHDVSRRLRPEPDGLVALGRHNGKLLDDEQVQRLSVHLLPGHEVENGRVQVGSEQPLPATLRDAVARRPRALVRRRIGGRRCSANTLQRSSEVAGPVRGRAVLKLGPENRYLVA